MSDKDTLETRIKTALDQGIDELDAATLSKIRQVRSRAMDKAASKTVNWSGILSGAVATACVMVFVAMIALNNEAAMPALPAEDIELITSLDELEMYEDLEFYQWLAEYES